jgi:hypothetical protein
VFNNKNNKTNKTNKKYNKSYNHNKDHFWRSIFFLVFIKLVLLTILWRVCFYDPVIHHLDDNKLVMHFLDT